MALSLRECAKHDRVRWRLRGTSAGAVKRPAARSRAFVRLDLIQDREQHIVADFVALKRRPVVLDKFGRREMAHSVQLTTAAPRWPCRTRRCSPARRDR